MCAPAFDAIRYHPSPYRARGLAWRRFARARPAGRHVPALLGRWARPGRPYPGELADGFDTRREGGRRTSPDGSCSTSSHRWRTPARPVRRVCSARSRPRCRPVDGVGRRAPGAVQVRLAGAADRAMQPLRTATTRLNGLPRRAVVTPSRPRRRRVRGRRSGWVRCARTERPPGPARGTATYPCAPVLTPSRGTAPPVSHVGRPRTNALRAWRGSRRRCRRSRRGGRARRRPGELAPGVTRTCTCGDARARARCRPAGRPRPATPDRR